MRRTDIKVQAGQVWGDSSPQAAFGRELLVRQVDERYAYCIDIDGRHTRILLRRMKPRKGGYYLIAESPARYVEVPSEEGLCICSHSVEKHGDLGCLACAEKLPLGGCVAFQSKKLYQVWTGDLISPAHCPCENFRWVERKPGEIYLCKHLRMVLQKEGAT